MYCGQCGAKVRGDEFVCRECGRATWKAADAPRDKVLFRLRPRYRVGATLVRWLPMHVGLTVFGGGFAGTVACSVLVNSWLTYVAAAGFFFVAVPIGTCWWSWWRSAQEEYRFHPDRLEFRAGLPYYRRWMSVRYRNIKSVRLTRGPLGYNALTLVAGTGVGALSFTHVIEVEDVEHAERVYEAVKELIAQSP